ncbi:MAG: beta-lactamase family protein [Sphingomonadales bacterium]|nr:beta-lactamase family protein [Sphingomonadales bacterium]
MINMDRRSFLMSSCLAGAYAVLGAGNARSGHAAGSFIERTLREFDVPGCAAAVVKGGRLVWSGGYGWADIGKKVPMTSRTVMNIASISKTITATAVMQLWEAGRIDLDSDVGDHFPFPVRNPKFPAEVITVRQLLNHRSSIRDGGFYRNSYSCGDPVVGLTDWIEGYFRPGGAYHDADDNFHDWPPGTLEPNVRSRGYSNVAYGLLGNLVERVSGTDFSDYCKANILMPLGMNSTGWHIREIEPDRHAVLYGKVSAEALEMARASFQAVLPAPGYSLDRMSADARMPHCLYSFPNYPDGLIRTSVEDLALFLSFYAAGGNGAAPGILQDATVQLMLSDARDGRALCWARRTLENGDLMWGHSGSDPGVNTYMGFREKDGVGVIVFLNADSTGKARNLIIEHLFREAEAL